MRMAGPREALWHAIIRKNHGCTHLIVGRDHAGPGKDATGRPFYGPYDAQELLRAHEAELGVAMVPFRNMVYVEDRDGFLPDDEVPAGSRVLELSGTELRRRLSEGREIPHWFTFPEIAEELQRSHPPRKRQGFTVFFTGLSGAGKSTIANVLLSRFLEMGGRPVTLLDGDVVRRSLSSELGFSRRDRDINIRRIGFVASEITKNGGIALCAPIAPYDSVRKEVRAMVAAVGGFVARPRRRAARGVRAARPQGPVREGPRRASSRSSPGSPTPTSRPRTPRWSCARPSSRPRRRRSRSSCTSSGRATSEPEGAMIQPEELKKHERLALVRRIGRRRLGPVLRVRRRGPAGREAARRARTRASCAASTPTGRRSTSPCGRTASTSPPSCWSRAPIRSAWRSTTACSRSAAIAGTRRCASLLEEHFASRLNASPRGEAVAAAIRERDLPKVRSLLDASPELLHAGDERSNQPIHWAVMTRQIEVVDELLARGADIDAPRCDGARPIQLTNGDYHFRGWRDVPPDWPTTPAQVLAHLRARGAHCDLGTACRIGDLERVRELLDQDPSLANRVSEYVTYYLGSGAPLKNAAANGHLEIVELLLSRGADPNLPEEGIAPHGHALYSAVANRHFEIARILLEHGAFPNPEVESSADALSRAIANSDQPMIDLLCSYGAARAVHLLAYYGDVRTAAAVFAANPALADDPDALVNAAGEGHEAFVRLMLRYQPDLPKRDHVPGLVGRREDAGAQRTALRARHEPEPARLAARHAAPPLREERGRGGRRAVPRPRRRPRTRATRTSRSTPLGWAAKYGQLEMVELLLERGAKASLPDDPPWATPLAWANRRGHREIADLLLRHGPR